MKIIIGIFVGSVVAIISTLFGKWLSRDSAQKAIDIAFPKTIELITHSEFVKAGIQFREAFMNTLNKLKSREILQLPGGPTESNMAHYVLDKALPKQR